ncbi:hypothetical protein AB205_0042400 [Aquarana catesbeiana]|uniref:G-protein coupled receptors family 1 profile domain-containing protein n=1 Tax=Aquarana catesbeiana TaxID=8400 RepID=A0A2G9R5S9_AQUCT|nr:hypothetical protein AB205_0042400 [Aquarana catesbeiana]
MTIAVLVCLVPQLHTPIYFFLSNLAISDVIYVSVTLPKLLSILLTQDHWLSFSACMTQMYFFSLSAGCDIFLLTSMSYDRYIAVCKPIFLTHDDATSRNVFLLCQDVLLTSFSFLLIMTFYVFIISTIRKINSSEGRLKAYSSCTSHLTTVILFYGPVIILYGKPESEGSKELDKLLTLLYTAVVPMLNPFVYILRNQDVLNAIQNIKMRRNLIFSK